MGDLESPAGSRDACSWRSNDSEYSSQQLHPRCRRLSSANEQAGAPPPVVSDIAASVLD